MEPEACPNCGTWVIRKADGSCPACQSDVSQVSDSRKVGESESPANQSPIFQRKPTSDPRASDSRATVLRSMGVSLRAIVVLSAAVLCGLILFFHGHRLREPGVLGRLVNAAIPLLAGAYAILLGARAVGPRRGASEKFDQWHTRYGSTMLLLGPLVCLYGLYLAFSSVASNLDLPQAPQRTGWRRYTTSDGACSAEFPTPPVRDKQTTFGVESTRLTLRIPGTGDYYMLTFSDVPPDTPPSTDDEKLDAMPDNIQVMGEQAGHQYKLVHADKIVENGIVGREFEFSVDASHTFRTKVFIVGSRIHRIIAVTRQGEQDGPDTARFLSSFRLASTAPIAR
ncbi:MAG: hypothetical protein ACM3U2_09085 [Deltaproteobacteria bacterium]